jgi:ribosome-associated protein
VKKIIIPNYEFKFSFSRSSGAGGQNVNKVSSKVTLYWAAVASNSLPISVKNRFLVKYKNKINEEGILVMSSETTRSQLMNKSECLTKFQKMLDNVTNPRISRVKTKPTRASVKRRVENKVKKGQLKKLRREKF